MKLRPHQLQAVERLETGKILCGGVGTGKSLTAIAYWWTEVCGATQKINGKGEWSKPITPVDLVIITTARKRDELDWQEELVKFAVYPGVEGGVEGLTITVDSWNNIAKYEGLRSCFFVFDEQRLVGSGAWVRSFYKIARKNDWILLSGTPGDTWMDYIPVFVANGYYANKTEFIDRHCIYNRFSKYPKVDRYVNTKRLEKLRELLLVDMPYERTTQRIRHKAQVDFDREAYKSLLKNRCDPETGEPFKNSSALMAALRRTVNTHPSRLAKVREVLSNSDRTIIFYNFDYELEILRGLSSDFLVAEWNGHKHEPVPNSDRWVYLVQYAAGAEAWNCVETDTMIMYSLTYSHRVMEQAEGRIDRLTTAYSDLHYYKLVSSSSLDLGIWEALRRKKTFSESAFVAKLG